MPDPDVVVQLSYAEIKQMSPAAVAAAHKAGQCSELLAGRDPGEVPPDDGTLGIEDLKKLSEGTLRRLKAEGKIDDILEGLSLVEAGLVPPPGDADLGARGGPPIPRQLKQSDLAGMAPGEISKAYAEGRCDELLGRLPKARTS